MVDNRHDFCGDKYHTVHEQYSRRDVQTPLDLRILISKCQQLASCAMFAFTEASKHASCDAS